MGYDTDFKVRSSLTNMSLWWNVTDTKMNKTSQVWSQANSSVCKVLALKTQGSKDPHNYLKRKEQREKKKDGCWCLRLTSGLHMHEYTCTHMHLQCVLTDSWNASKQTKQLCGNKIQFRGYSWKMWNETRLIESARALEKLYVLFCVVLTWIKIY